MSASELRAWMDKNDKTVINIASDLSLSVDTVRRYLKGESVNRSTQKLIESLLKQDPPTKAATA